MKVPVKVKRKPPQKHWLRLLTACIGMVLLILLMFLLGKGPATVFFTSSEDTGLSGLHSQCIRLSAASVVADLSQQHLCKATVSAPEVRIASAALETWIREKLPDSYREGYLCIRNGESGISFTWEARKYHGQPLGDHRYTPDRYRSRSYLGVQLQCFPGMVVTPSDGRQRLRFFCAFGCGYLCNTPAGGTVGLGSAAGNGAFSPAASGFCSAGIRLELLPAGFPDRNLHCQGKAGNVRCLRAVQTFPAIRRSQKLAGVSHRRFAVSLYQYTPNLYAG